MTREQEIIQRHAAFWRRGPVDRPIGCCWVGSRLPDQLYPTAKSIPNGLVTPADIDVEGFASDYERLQRWHEEVQDDALWVVAPFYGIPWVEAILGCPVHYSGETFWVDPIWPEWPDRLDLPMETGQEWLRKLLEFTRVLVQRAEGRHGVAMTLMRGPSDLAAAVRGHEAMIYDMFDHPEELTRLIEAMTSVWIDVARRQLDLIPPYHGGYVSNFYGAWASEPVIFTQEDASASFSPPSFRRFLLPADRRIADTFPYSIMHVHSPTVWPVKQWLEIDSLSCVEINYDNNGPRLPELLPILEAVQERKPLIIRGELTTEEIAYVKRELSPSGLLLNLVAETVPEAEAQMAALRA